MIYFLRFLLFPFAFLYGIAVWFRNFLFDTGLKEQVRFKIPVICVGNLSVGGTGKTPHIEYIIKLLEKEGLNIAVLSRGYGRSTRGFLLGKPGMSAEELGDEPLQIMNKFPEVKVAVRESRIDGINRLLELFPELDVVLLDDAYQHRYVKPGFTVLLSDYSRPFFNDWLLPVGRLREGRRNKKRADVIVMTKSPASLSEEAKQTCIKKVAPLEHQSVHFSRIEYGNLYELANPARKMPLTALQGIDIHVLTAIARPEPILRSLANAGAVPHAVTFPDHHYFSGADLEKLNMTMNNAAAEHSMVVITEKDAVKLTPEMFSSAGISNVWVLPVEMAFMPPSSVDQHILSYVKRNRKE